MMPAHLDPEIFSGFLDRYPNVKLIAAHGGATLPYLASRLDRCHEMIPACSSVIKEKPSEYLKRIWYDTVVYDQRALDLLKSMSTEEERERATVYMEGLAEMRKDWTKDPKPGTGGGKGGGKRKRAAGPREGKTKNS